MFSKSRALTGTRHASHRDPTPGRNCKLTRVATFLTAVSAAAAAAAVRPRRLALVARIFGSKHHGIAGRTVPVARRRSAHHLGEPADLHTWRERRDWEHDKTNRWSADVVRSDTMASRALRRTVICMRCRGLPPLRDLCATRRMCLGAKQQICRDDMVFTVNKGHVLCCARRGGRDLAALPRPCRPRCRARPRGGGTKVSFRVLALRGGLSPCRWAPEVSVAPARGGRFTSRSAMEAAHVSRHLLSIIGQGCTRLTLEIATIAGAGSDRSLKVDARPEQVSNSHTVQRLACMHAKTPSPAAGLVSVQGVVLPVWRAGPAQHRG
jgi:hypothetical protein